MVYKKRSAVPPWNTNGIMAPVRCNTSRMRAWRYSRAMLRACVGFAAPAVSERRYSFMQDPPLGSGHYFELVSFLFGELADQISGAAQFWATGLLGKAPKGL